MNIIILLNNFLSYIKTYIYGLKHNIKIGKGTHLDFSSRIFIDKGGSLYLGENCYLKAFEPRHHTGLPFKATIYATKDTQHKLSI